MLAFEINGQLLPVDDNTSISMEMVSSIFIEDGDILPGSYSFPFTVLLDNDARQILRHPDRIDLYKNYPEFDNVLLYVDGKPVFLGKIYLLSANETTAKMSFVVNEFKKLEDINIRELTNLGEVTWNSSAALISMMDDSTIHPENHNIVFCPVFNPDYFDDAQKDAVNPDYDEWWQQRVQNYWSIYTTAFEYGDKKLAITPFVKLHHLYVKIFEYFNFNLVDAFFDIEQDYKRVYLYSNKSVNAVNDNYNSVVPFVNGLNVTSHSLTKFLPNIKCIDLIKRIRATFFLAVLPNPFKKQVKVMRYSDILAAPIRHDWTEKMLTEYENTSQNVLPKEFGYEPTEDGFFADFNTDKPDADAPYSIERNAHYEETSFSNPFSEAIYSMNFKRIKFPEGILDPYLSKLAPLYNTFPGLWKQYFGTFAYHYPNLPMIKQRGHIKFKYGTEIFNQESESDIRLLFYRGRFNGARSFNEGSTVVTYPYATPGEHSPEQADGSYLPLADANSLLWNGPKGIYERRAKQYIDTLQYQKQLKCKLALSVADIINFRYEDKVRIRGNNFLVKSLRVTFSKSGIAPVEAVLIRVN